MGQPLQIKKQGKVLSFGEFLLRICPDAAGDWLNENKLSFYVAGAELNVATDLALWNIPVKYMSAMPDNDMSKQLVSYMVDKGIDTSSILYQGDRIGLFFLTKGKDLKNDALIYDRANSAFSELKPGSIDWDKHLEGINWFHFSAICPAINQNIADICKEALIAASEKNIITSVDLNYRSKLWKYGKSPLEVMPGLVEHCDMVMGNVWAAEMMLGVPLTPDMHESGQKSIYQKEALKTSEAIMKQFPKCKAVANTFRFDNRDEISYYAAMLTGDKFHTSSEYNADRIVDKVGSGDCFMAGLIYGFYNGLDPGEALEFATAAAFKKLFIESDATTSTVDDIKNAMKYEG